ncbi:FUSC family protein [Caballeronia sp. LZ062]|uniref:FUSC family protein n=1 Tax=unclassified Caballeronia TaxID=2646786 RepID=UPI00285F9A91|nr:MULTISPECIES: FUSC family protein [unclassified Caballeronia]MDR5856724.1 FUSC family protein [Caballeronia sp. LZ050]MDR5869879.1 FUSC family protein [Caballeronia sp. LZ062]
MSLMDRPRTNAPFGGEVIDGLQDWLATDGALWLHLSKTLIAAFLAMGLAMRLELPQPRIAMTTTFVLMQPFSGMVLAKGVYRFAGTMLGMVAAVVLGAVCVQQAELYAIGLTIWVATCTALAVRYRQYRWYGWVLAGYTAALIGVPLVAAPDQLLLAALTRGAEVMIGIVCSGVVSVLLLPRHASAKLTVTLAQREAAFKMLAAEIVCGGLDPHVRERRYTELVADIVGFESTRRLAAYENPALRAQRMLLSQLNNAFMSACSRLHALDQSIKRLRVHIACPALAAFLSEFSNVLHLTDCDRHALMNLKTSLSARLEDASQIDIVTCAELLDRLICDLDRIAQLRAALSAGHRDDMPTARYVAKTDGFVVATTFARTAMVIAAVAAFWVATAWPSGGLALIGATLTCGLSSASARPARFVAEMAAGTAGAVVIGYFFLCHVYPAIDGFPLLCAMLSPPLALGTFIAMRRPTAGYGVGFCVFFCLLAAPDNVIVYDPAMLLNNGIAILVSMLVTSMACAILIPPHTPWLVGKTLAALRAQAALACEAPLVRLSERFHSGTHDLMSQLLALSAPYSRGHRRALAWMLVTLEVGQAMIDLRALRATLDVDELPAPVRLSWASSLARMLRDVAMLFRMPSSASLRRAISSVVGSIFAAEALLESAKASSANRSERMRDLQRILACLHFIRSALIDTDAPFDASR